MRGARPLEQARREGVERLAASVADGRRARLPKRNGAVTSSTSAPARASAAASSWSYAGVKAGGSASTTRMGSTVERLLVRTWNLFHGNTKPPGRKAFLDEMVRLATVDAPGIVCLQEVPVWALSRLGRWSGMTAVGDVAKRPSLGPFPGRPSSAACVTDLNHALFRSAVTGQANAMLVGSGLTVVEHRRRRSQSVPLSARAGSRGSVCGSRGAARVGRRASRVPGAAPASRGRTHAGRRRTCTRRATRRQAARGRRAAACRDVRRRDGLARASRSCCAVTSISVCAVPVRSPSS